MNCFLTDTTSQKAVFSNVVCNFVPVVSSATNILDIGIKIILDGYSMVDPSIEQNVYVKFMKQKSYCLCGLLTIPGINICTAFVPAIIANHIYAHDALLRAHSSFQTAVEHMQDQELNEFSNSDS